MGDVPTHVLNVGVARCVCMGANGPSADSVVGAFSACMGAGRICVLLDVVGQGCACMAVRGVNVSSAGARRYVRIKTSRRSVENVVDRKFVVMV